MQGFSSIFVIIIFIMFLGFEAIMSKFDVKIRSLLPLIFLPLLLFWLYLESSYLMSVLQGKELLDGGAMMGLMIIQIPAFILMSPALIGFSLGIEIFKKRWSSEPLALMVAAVGIAFAVSTPYLFFSPNSYIVLSAITLGGSSVAIQLGMRKYKRRRK